MLMDLFVCGSATRMYDSVLSSCIMWPRSGLFNHAIKYINFIQKEKSSHTRCHLAMVIYTKDYFNETFSKTGDEEPPAVLQVIKSERTGKVSLYRKFSHLKQYQCTGVVNNVYLNYMYHVYAKRRNPVYYIHVGCKAIVWCFIC